MPLPRGLLKRLIREGYSAPEAMKAAWRMVREAGELPRRTKRRNPGDTRPDQYVESAVRYYQQEGQRGIDWVFHQAMSADDRARFDRWLVGLKHPLAYEAGTTEQRFTRIVKEAAREMKKNPGARWHGKEATRAEGERYSAEGRGSFIGAHYYRGKRDAHRESQDESRRMGLNPSSAYDVFLRGKKIDTVFQTDPSSAEEVKRSLVEHDGYDPEIRVVKKRTKRLPPLFRRRRNPGAAWHEEEETEERASRARMEVRGRPAEAQYFRGRGNAHRYSAQVSRQMGLNPDRFGVLGPSELHALRRVAKSVGAKVRWLSDGRVRVYFQSGRVSEARTPEHVDAIIYAIKTGEANPRSAKTVVGRVFRAKRWAKRWARGRPVRKVKGGWQVQAGRKRTSTNAPLKVVQYQGHTLKNRTGRTDGWSISHGGRIRWGTLAQVKTDVDHLVQYGKLPDKLSQNPIAVYNPPPGRMIYGQVLAVQARKTNGTYRGKSFQHKFSPASRVAMYALPDGSVLLKSGAGKRLWQDR